MVGHLCNTAGPQHTDTQADDVVQMEEVVVVEAQRRSDERDQAQATATRLTAALETALVSPPAIPHCWMCQLGISRQVVNVNVKWSQSTVRAVSHAPEDVHSGL